MRPDGPRDPLAGPDAGPESPFPIKLSGPVIRGFGRGSKELGIPTANIPPSGLSAYPELSTGVYYGFVGLSVPPSSLASATAKDSTFPAEPTVQQPASSETDLTTPQTALNPTSTDPPQIHLLPSVLSIGYNPFYANKTRSIEIHILRPFTRDFYGAPLNLLILGFIRPEYDYVSLDALIEDIRIDCEVAERSLAREGYRKFMQETWLSDFSWVKRDDKGEIIFEEGDGEVKSAEIKE